MATCENEKSTVEEYLTCSLCLDTFRSPKLLPCSHTFCEACLKDLVSNHPSGKFPCPSCREEIQVPQDGVSAFKNNFYIKPEELQRARDGSYCSKHPKKEIELYCVDCDVLMCVTCLVTKHNQHKAEDISEATERFKTQLDKDIERLERCVGDVQKHVQLVTQEQQAVKDKHTALVANIRNRQATLKAAVDKYTDDALASLHNITTDITDTHKADLHCLQQNLQQLTKLQQRVQQAVDSGAGCELVTVAREMRCGRGSEEAVQKLTTKQMTTVCRPVLRFSATLDATLKHMRDYMGSAAKMEMAVSAPEVTVMEQFRCRDYPDTDVYHVCPMTNDEVWVSYEPNMMREGATSELFSTGGKLVETDEIDVRMRITSVPRKNGLCMYSGSETYAKRTEPQLTRFFGLHNDLTGQATVSIVKIVSEDPLEYEYTNEFLVKCGVHRAFDVDASEQLFLVLEEAQTPDLQRTVRLYRRPQPDAIATYSPPVAPFQPSDVCFYTLGGHEVLLVADELNDAIHVVNVQDGRLSFARYLAPGCPLLVQPTALNTDTRGRLWVACRGGTIITCTPILFLLLNTSHAYQTAQ
ncbi:hypothetical protein BaRGS_00025325 [Batillaria attramentaria]|uniref:Uncharacterized protein n=1 Tax=Batillaria attramentaria TaxID=370345 RepID=A0ABD0K8I1_9CAEN